MSMFVVCLRALVCVCVCAYSSYFLNLQVFFLFFFNELTYLAQGFRRFIFQYLVWWTKNERNIYLNSLVFIYLLNRTPTNLGMGTLCDFSRVMAMSTQRVARVAFLSFCVCVFARPCVWKWVIIHASRCVCVPMCVCVFIFICLVVSALCICIFLRVCVCDLTFMCACVRCLTISPHSFV